ncbi:FdhF/YdeP family oxidoreductase [Teredinibacter purpureus]|uniref:FdhF/YdeP family oxidoreductase n=1 Tax=Teredinibacter purpureus TaxID=2731756 RepID=UPI000695B4FD|nr:FdhF/YdeP family oxidoreductase [Teredinibacter purpureus]
MMKNNNQIVGGGWKAVLSVLRYAQKIGPYNLWKTLRSKNACKACAFGTGGQKGGFKNEAGRGIEVCNKNIQAHLSDVRAGIPATVFLSTSIAEFNRMSGQQLEALGRLTIPLYKKAGDTHFTPLSYDKALSLAATKLKAASPERSFFYASGRSSNEAAFLLQLMARLYGTNNVNNCSYYCHQASGVGLTSTLGTSTATIRYDDLDKADCIFVFGANPASNHPRFVKALMHCRRRGGKVIVVNPAKEPGMVKFASPSDWRSMLKGGEDIASHYVQPHLGGDVAFMQGVAKWVLDNAAHDTDFIEHNTEGFDDFSASIHALEWDDIERNAGCFRHEIEAIAAEYAAAKNVVFSWSMGLTHHHHGVDNIETLVALALLRAMVGRPGAGLLPLRGHSNIQGTGSMGFTPALKTSVEEKLQERLGASLPQATGLDTMACMHAASVGNMDVAVMLGGNLLASNPDHNFAVEAMNRINFKCFITSTLNSGHVGGSEGEVLIFPIKVRDEELQPTTQESMFNFVRLSNGGINRFPQLRSEVDLIGALGEKLIDIKRLDFSLFRDHQRIRDFIGDVVPGYSAVSTIGHSREEFHIAGRTLHQPVFPTATGKAAFVFSPTAKRSHSGIWRNHEGEHEFTLTSVRSEGQFNSIIYDERDTYRGQENRWVVLMNPRDMQLCGYHENSKVTISTDTGEMKALNVKPFDVRCGNIMVYYPEANVLIPRGTDERSKTPGFKSVAVRVV